MAPAGSTHRADPEAKRQLQPRGPKAYGGSRSGKGKPQPRGPFLLVIVDRDTGRFTIEGPLTDAEGWMKEIAAARRAGRRITYRMAYDAVEAAVKSRVQAWAGTQWPPGSIIAPAGDFPLSSQPIQNAAASRLQPRSMPRRETRRGDAERGETERRKIKRRGSEPFLLIIVDHDNRRFTIEGPMTDAEGWTRQIIAARRWRRQITCRVFPGSVKDALRICRSIRAGTRWPSGSIIANLQDTLSPGPTIEPAPDVRDP
jgi:hypothetical protein